MAPPKTTRCEGFTLDGSRCGRRVWAPATKCIKHDGSPAVGVCATGLTEMSPIEMLQRLTRDTDPTVRLRAIDMLFKHTEAKTSKCEKCISRASREEGSAAFLAWVHADAERESALQDHFDQFDLLMKAFYRASPDAFADAIESGRVLPTFLEEEAPADGQ